MIWIRQAHADRHTDEHTDITLSKLSIRELISKLSSSSPNGFSNSSATYSIESKLYNHYHH